MFDVALSSGTGIDASGIVDEVGAGVTDVPAGDAAFGIGQGVLAEHAVVNVVRDPRRPHGPAAQDRTHARRTRPRG
ncbi:MAG: hypothetical protein SYR96_27050 [Actinomycetota bacterium]|nr:hypothetical protein [Actinomycetota bacterium]